ncbi:hypothetical protein EV130_101290 [Rhizobium azibense]|uniref:Uncharacterized protein n=1 Tax=Rhizobium azibense TaxID=1136135 RepID=A0A4R3RH92_9HYPH|nr:hypothetical protein EV130_101290 [Rhizobium azibense]TCU41271.1 hypothetical protein EV129_101559 [Rhizobium azibense]
MILAWILSLFQDFIDTSGEPVDRINPLFWLAR